MVGCGSGLPLPSRQSDYAVAPANIYIAGPLQWELV